MARKAMAPKMGMDKVAGIIAGALPVTEASPDPLAALISGLARVNLDAEAARSASTNSTVRWEWDTLALGADYLGKALGALALAAASKAAADKAAAAVRKAAADKADKARKA